MIGIQRVARVRIDFIGAVIQIHCADENRVTNDHLVGVREMFFS